MVFNRVTTTSFLTCILTVFVVACTRNTNSAHELEFGKHHITIKPQCRGASESEESESDNSGKNDFISYSYTCGETTVRIHHGSLSVNGKSYGMLNDDDALIVDHGQVFVNSRAR
jgi:hypothetical protein